MRRLLAALAAVAGCGGGGDAGEAIDAAPPVRRVSLTGVAVDARGISDPIRVQVPDDTRSIGVVARGGKEALYALAWLETADGVEHVRLPADVELGSAMRDQYFTEQVGAMPGELYQSIRLGMFTHVHPNRPDLPVPAGEVVLRIATSDPAAGPVDVDVFLPADDGARTLVLNVFAVSSDFAWGAPEELPFLRGLRDVLGAGGLAIEVAEVVNLPDSGLSIMTELSEPQEPPTSMSSELALLGGAMVPGEGLNVFVVDALPVGVAGWSLGTPGPPLADTYYSGVVAAVDDAGPLARVLAHEIAHYLGLSHVVNTGLSGTDYPDPLDDTEPGQGNLMAGEGIGLSPDQAFVLSRSPLLR